MFASDVMRPGRCVVLGAALLVSCGNPLDNELPLPDARLLNVVAVLDPDSATTPFLLQRVMRGSAGVMHAIIEEAGAVVAEDSVPADVGEDELDPCFPRFGSLIGSPRCINLRFQPVAGGTYSVSIFAADHDTARGTTTVPGEFSIVSLSQQGSPPGTVQLSATWSRSAGAHRYIVVVQGRQDNLDGDGCFPDATCYPRWHITTRDTTFSGTVDAKYFEEAVGPFSFTVYAANEELFEFLMTGNADTFFPVPPAQNVSGGAGVVGAWVVRRRLLQ